VTRRHSTNALLHRKRVRIEAKEINLLYHAPTLLSGGGKLTEMVIHWTCVQLIYPVLPLSCAKSVLYFPCSTVTSASTLTSQTAHSGHSIICSTRNSFFGLSAYVTVKQGVVHHSFTQTKETVYAEYTQVYSRLIAQLILLLCSTMNWTEILCQRMFAYINFNLLKPSGNFTYHQV
jgi:hypothetical protein